MLDVKVTTSWVLKAAWIYLLGAPEAPSLNFCCCSEIKALVGLCSHLRPCGRICSLLHLLSAGFFTAPYTPYFCGLLAFFCYSLPIKFLRPLSYGVTGNSTYSFISHNTFSILKSQLYHIWKKKPEWPTWWHSQISTKHLKFIIGSWYLGFESHPSRHNQ